MKNDLGKKITAIVAFIVGFLIMLLVGMSKMDFRIKAIAYALIFAILFGIAFLIYYFQTHDVGYNIYKVIVDEARIKRVNQDLIKLGINKHLLDVDILADNVKISIRHNGYICYLRVSKNLVELGYEANNDYIHLLDSDKIKADSLIDGLHETHKDYKKLTKNQLYQKLIEFNNKSKNED